MDSPSRLPSAVYSPITAFRSVPDLGAYPITGCSLFFSNSLFICSSAAKSSRSLIVETSNTEPGLLVEKVEASMGHELNEGTSTIATAKSPSSDIVIPAPLRSSTPPVSRQESPQLPPHSDAAEATSSLVDDAPSSASALLAQVTCNKPLSEPDSDKGSVIMGTPGVDSDEDLLPSTSSRMEGEEFSQLPDCLHDSDGSSSQRAPRKPKKKSSRCRSSDLVHSFKKTLGANDIV